MVGVHPYRGLAFHEDAVSFAEQWSKGSVIFDNEENDFPYSRWGEIRGYIKIPNGKVRRDKSCNEWQGYIHRRRWLRYKVNLASTHDRMLSVGVEPYKVVSAGANVLSVLAAEHVAPTDDTPGVITRHYEARVRALKHVREATDAKAVSMPGSVPDLLHIRVRDIVDDAERRYELMLFQERQDQLRLEAIRLELREHGVELPI